MFLNAKKMSFLGLLLACAVILVILGSLLEFNTLFLLAGASFCIGIAILECGFRIGSGFYIASVLLSFLLTPDKLSCITFAAVGLYLVIVEYSFDKLTYVKWDNSKRKIIFRIIKFVTFNIMYIPILLLLPELFYQGQLNKGLLAAFFFTGQVVLFIYDKAYSYFLKHIWGKIRGKLHL